ncbi:MAG TPA: sulfatase [Opitutaceae bacterium]
MNLPRILRPVRAVLPLALAVLAAATTDAAEPSRPNLVLIVSDDHSYPHVGAYGFPVATPALDRFAREGMAFSHMFTTAPQCAPSRASFATGRSSVAVRASRFSAGVPRAVEMFPEILRRDAGYYTGICRRSHHLDGWVHDDHPVTRALFEKHGLRTVPERFDFVKMGGKRADTPVYVAEFLDRVPAGKPFFLWVNFNDPHHPWTAPAVNDPATVPLPPDWPDLPELRADFAHYLDEVAQLDREFQSVLDQLAQRGLADNTLVVFVGDNGVALPRGKGALHDRGLRVPLLVRWPGALAAAGRTSDALVSGEDFAPTFLEAAGLPVPADMAGRSFLPLLRGEPAYRPRTEIFAMRGVHGTSTYDETTLASGFDLSRAVRTDRYKLIVNYTPGMRYAPVDSAGEPGWQLIQKLHAAHELRAPFERLFFATPRPIVELYDLARDPGEITNLAGRPEFAEVQRDLTVRLQEKMIVDYDYLPLPLRESARQ